MLDATLKDLVRKDSRGFGIASTWANVQPRLTEFDLEHMANEGYRRNSIASACISMLATSAPEAPLKVWRETEDGPQEVEGHWLVELLKRPNPYMSQFELWEWTVTYLQTAGNCYWELVRAGEGAEVTEIYPLRPDRMRIVPGEDYISHYLYSVNGTDIEYLPWEILHIKLPDPRDEFYGLSPLGRVMREIDLDNLATDFTRTFFANHAQPAGILTTDQVIPDENTANSIRDRFWRFISGKNTGKPALIGHGVTYQQTSLDFSQMEFESTRSFTETRICSAFGVDPVLLPSWVGIKYGGKYSNYKEARRHLWDESIIPLLHRIEGKVTAALLFGEDVFAQFDLGQVSALQEDAAAVWTRAAEAYTAKLLTRNEARALIGHDAVEGGDDFEAASEPRAVGNLPEDAETPSQEVGAKSHLGKTNGYNPPLLFM